jgi:hypothetical protein
MIVLTDGRDTEFVPGVYEGYKMPGDELYHKHGSPNIPDFIYDQFKDSGIQINIVGFQL